MGIQSQDLKGISKIFGTDLEEGKSLRRNMIDLKDTHKAGTRTELSAASLLIAEKQTCVLKAQESIVILFPCGLISPLT